MKMKLVRATRKADAEGLTSFRKHNKSFRKSDADWKSYKDPVAVLKKDLDSFVKLCKEAKKKVDGLMDKGAWLQLDKANEFFTRAVIVSRELQQELEDATVWVVWDKKDKKIYDGITEIRKSFDEENKKLKDITANLDLVGKRLAELKPAFSTIRKTFF